MSVTSEITSTSSTLQTSSVSEQSTTSETTAEQVSFADILSDFVPLDASEEINEEQLFSAIVAERVEGLKGTEALEQYQESFESYLSSMEQSNGYVPVEDAARAALDALYEDGVLSLDEAESIHAESFQAAQLDDNTDALYDSLGSTIAVTMVDMALESSSAMLAAFDSGEMDAGQLSLDFQQGVDSSGGVVEGSSSQAVTNATIGDGFLFKPVSESDGNLAILLPSSMSGQVTSLTISDSDGTVLESGNSMGDYDDGRPLYRFSEPGGSYPDNIVVTATLSDGTEYTYNIASPEQRYE